MSVALLKKLGRPAHVPTARTRTTVAIAAGAGMRHADIAAAVGLGRSALERHYAVELRNGAAAKRLEVIVALYQAARRGRTTAVKAYLRRGDVQRSSLSGPKERRS